MSFKGLKSPLEPDAVLGMQPVSDSEDDLSSPECLSLQPVRDDYSSDDEAKKKVKMLNNTAINGSDAKPWELKHFLKFGFESFFGKFTMENIKAQGLLENAFTMFFPEGFPACYKTKNNISENDSMESIVSKCYLQFMENNQNKWLMQLIPYDFNKTNKEYVEKMKKQLDDILLENYDIFEFHDSYLLAARFADVMYYLIKDESRPKNPAADHNKNKKQELVKGLVYQIMSYLKIPVMFNGEGRYDFQHQHIPGRTLEEPVSFKIEPDASVFIHVRSCQYRMPFGVVEVHGPVSKGVLDKVRKCSAEDCVLSSAASERVEKKERAPDTIVEEDLVDVSDIPCACKDLKNLHKLPDGVINEMKSLSISKEKPDPSDHIKVSVSTPTDRCSVESSSQGCSDTSIYKSDKKKEQINDEIKGIGPRASADDLVFTKFYGKLPLEMYGMLIKRDKCLREEFGVCQEKPLVGLGIFVMNEYVYLAKITDIRKNLPGLEPQSCGPTVTYANNFWFNLKNPEHLFAFMYFMLCYYKIELTVNLNRQYEKHSILYLETKKALDKLKIFFMK